MQVSLNQNNLINNHMNDEPRRLDLKKKRGESGVNQNTTSTETCL